MSVPGIEAIGAGIPRIAPITPSSVAETGSVAEMGAGAGAGGGFADLLSAGVDNLQATHTNVNELGIKAATGDLTDAHDYMLASTQSGLVTQLTTTVRNKAVEAFQEIMRMQS